MFLIVLNIHLVNDHNPDTRSMFNVTKEDKVRVLKVCFSIRVRHADLGLCPDVVPPVCLSVIMTKRHQSKTCGPGFMP